MTGLHPSTTLARLASAVNLAGLPVGSQSVAGATCGTRLATKWKLISPGRT